MTVLVKEYKFSLVGNVKEYKEALLAGGLNRDYNIVDVANVVRFHELLDQLENTCCKNYGMHSSFKNGSWNFN